MITLIDVNTAKPKYEHEAPDHDYSLDESLGHIEESLSVALEDPEKWFSKKDWDYVSIEVLESSHRSSILEPVAYDFGVQGALTEILECCPIFQDRLGAGVKVESDPERTEVRVTINVNDPAQCYEAQYVITKLDKDGYNELVHEANCAQCPECLAPLC